MNKHLHPYPRPMVLPGRACLAALVLPLLAALGLLLAGCSSDKKEAAGRMRGPVSVTAGAVVQKDALMQIRVIGKVEPFATVSVKSRITGQLLSVHFTEGQVVKKDQLLFTIDPRPFEVALQQAQAQLAKDQALAQKAEEDLRRYQGLVQRQVVSPSQYEQYRTDAAAKQAAVKASQAEVDNAKLNLLYCHITSPLTGPTGNLLANAGNMIKANDDNKSMVVIQQIEPSYVSFNVAERYLAEVRDRLARGKLPVTAQVPGQEAQPLTGELVFVDNAVDTATGTIRLKASFPNRDQRLWPAQFVNVVLNLSDLPGALVVPARAIQTGQVGDYVFVIKDDQTVEVRKISLGPRLDGEVVVKEGLQAGERVVTDGHLRLVPGAKVEIKPEPSSGQGGKS